MNATGQWKGLASKAGYMGIRERRGTPSGRERVGKGGKCSTLGVGVLADGIGGEGGSLN